MGGFTFWFRLTNLSGRAVFITGMYLHLTAILLGRELFLEKVFTPVFDMILAVPMTFAGVMGIALWKKTRLPTAAHRAVYGVLLAYFCVSIAVHVSTFFTRDTSYIVAFPEAFSYFIIPVQALFLYVFSSAEPRSGER